MDLLDQLLQLGVVYHANKHITQDGKEDSALLGSRGIDDNKQWSRGIDNICTYKIMNR